MAQVTIRINGYAYTVGCEDGQEPHLQAMAREVDRRCDRIKALGRQSGESQILVLASLLMADELHDLAAGASPTPPAPSGAPAGASDRDLIELAERAEDIAAMLERP